MRQRQFLFLQGPHGPFFGQLARALGRAGCGAGRVAFNAGDRAFWPRGLPRTDWQGGLERWPEAVGQMLDEAATTDLVVYGDARPVHRAAIAAARMRSITVHVFEEGYLRPFWITYERDGSNGASALCGIPTERILAAVSEHRAPPVEAPAHWGDLTHHMAYGALYHGLACAGGPAGLPPHRGVSYGREAALQAARLALRPAALARRALLTRSLLRGGAPYHLALLQLDHDASFRAWSPFESTAEVARTIVEAFARGAPAHHHLAFKDHPLEDGRAGHGAAIREAARRLGIAGRVHHLPGGKLARLLDPARSVVTVNSTAGQQALWRGLPLKALGESVYGRPGLVSDQSLASFFADPQPPNRAHYAAFRQFLLETSQIPGGYYAEAARRQAIRKLIDRMLDPADPYEKRLESGAARPQHILRIAPAM